MILWNLNHDRCLVIKHRRKGLTFVYVWVNIAYFTIDSTMARLKKNAVVFAGICGNTKPYGGPQLSHQKQMLTANYKSLTLNSNRSQQIQIAHSKLKSLTVNWNRSQQIEIAHSELQITHSQLQIAHGKFKSPTANSNRSQQIQIVHSKLKSLTANYKLLTPLGVLGYLQPAVQLYLSYMKPLLPKVRMSKPTRLLRFADGLCYTFFFHRGVSIQH